MVQLRGDLIIFVTIFLIKTTDAFDNTTDQFLEMNEDDLIQGRFLGNSFRKPRFLNIQRGKEEIAVRLEFGFQFLTIPVKRAMNIASGMINAIPTANFNVGTAIVGAAILLGTIVTIPALSNLMSISHANTREDSKRVLDSKVPLLDNFGDFINPSIQLIETCAQKALCSWVQKISQKEKDNDFEDFLFTVMNHKWFKSTDMLVGTPFADTIVAGSNGENCSTKYSKCKINQKTISSLAKMLTSFSIHKKIPALKQLLFL